MTNQQLFEYLKDQAYSCQDEQILSNIMLKLKELIETSDDFDIANAVCFMWFNFTESKSYGLSPEWVKAQLDRGIGDVAMAAALLQYHAPEEYTILWAKQQIERGIEDVAWAACCLCLTNLNKNGITIDWTKQQIERGIGEVKLAANYLYTKGYVTKKWRDQQLAKLEQNNDKSTTF